MSGAAVLGLALVLLAAGVAAVLWWGWLGVRVSALVEGRPDGTWAVAAGLRVAGFALSGAAAAGAEARVQLHLGRWRLWTSSAASLERFAGRRARAATTREPAARDGAPPARADTRSLAAPPLDAWLELLGDAWPLVRLGAASATLRYAFDDVVLMGRLYGALCALGAALPPRARLTQRALWGRDAQLGGELEVRWALRPLPLLVRTARWWLRSAPRLDAGGGERAAQGAEPAGAR